MLKRGLCGLALALLSQFVITPCAPKAEERSVKDFTNHFYRVHGLRGSQTLTMRSGPARYHERIGHVPFDARGLENLRRCARNWCLVEFNEQFGWMPRRHLANDNPKEDTVYQASAGVDRNNVMIHERRSAQSNILAKIPDRAYGIQSRGDCLGQWCPIQFNGINGWVLKRYLSVWLPNNPFLTN